MAEFNLFTIWHSLPNFLDYMFETLPTLHVSDLFADSHTKGSLAYWGYRLPIQLPLIWETLQLALASTLVAVAIATLLAFVAANNAWSPAPLRFAVRVLVVSAHHAGAGVGGDLRDGFWYRGDPRLSGINAPHHRQPDQAVL